MSELKSSRGGMALAVLLALACVLATSVMSRGSLSDEANALRLAELENQLSNPTSLVELTSTQLQSMDHAAIIAEHVQEAHQAEATAIATDDSAFKAMSEQEQREEVDASLAEVEAAEKEGRAVAGSALLQTSSKAMSSSDYWDNAWHRRWWCNAVRWGYWWIERHPHWQRVCSKIEQFRPWGWWSYFCHNIHSGHWGWWYRHNWWWNHQCNSIRNPNYVGNTGKWRWHPQHQRHSQSDWCEQNGHNFRDLNNHHYNHWCHGREAPKNYVRGLWDVDPKASRSQQANYWFCRQYRTFDNNWKSNNNMEAYRSRCSEGEGARGSKHPGYDPNLTPEQRAEIIAKAKRAAERAAAEAAKPKWVWSKQVPRTGESDWCEANGLTQSESSRYAKSCDGNRETEEDRLKRIARSKRRAEKRVMARIPVAKPAGTSKPVKQIPLKPFSKSPLVQQARRAAALRKAEAKLTPVQRQRRARKLAKQRAAARAALPANVKGANMAQMMSALKVASVAPAPKPKRGAKKVAFKPMPPPPVLPKKPASAPKLSQLKNVAKAVAAMRAAKTVPVKRKSKPEARRAAAKAAKAAAIAAGLPPKAAAAIAAAIIAGAPAPPARAHAPARAAARAQAPAPAPDAPAPAAPAAREEEDDDKAPRRKDAPAAAEPADPAEPAEPVERAPRAERVERELPPRPETEEERWHRVENERRKARRERRQAADREDEAAAARRAARIARDRLLRAHGPRTRDGVNMGENIDWDYKYPSPGGYVPTPEEESRGRRGKEGVKGCPTCKLRHMRKAWKIVLNPISVNAHDLPLLEELHRRVDYLVDPQKKRLAVAQNILNSARAQVVDAAEHHERIQDFGIKHKNQLLVPQYIQDEAKMQEAE